MVGKLLSVVVVLRCRSVCDDGVLHCMDIGIVCMVVYGCGVHEWRLLWMVHVRAGGD